MEAPVVFSSFLIKVASRCNLDCDYCYVYHHADQSWRTMPKLLAAQHQAAFAQRLEEYVSAVGLRSCSIIFHGGEPLLAGSDKLAEFATQLRQKVQIPIDISLQTNGLLLDAHALDTLARADIGISLSLDGPRKANDKHRLTKKGRSSFQQTEDALRLLLEHPSIFAGVIAVIDPSTSPDELFEYFSQFDIPRLDFLLPDAHWQKPPPGRNQNPGLYEEWLVQAFDLWLDQYSHIPVRTFDALLDTAVGISSGTDAFGFGDVSLLSIETDGSYHDLDVLKVTRDGATRLFGDVHTTSISEISCSAQINLHRLYLRKEGLNKKCQECDVVGICGGGSVPHRFDGQSFVNPTVYCNEMQRLARHVNQRLTKLVEIQIEASSAPSFPGDFNFAEYELAESAYPLITWLHDQAMGMNKDRLTRALELLPDHPNAQMLSILPKQQFAYIARQPGAFAWAGAMLAKSEGRSILSIDGETLEPDHKYLEFLCNKINDAENSSNLQIGENDTWLRCGFGKVIYFNALDITKVGQTLVAEAMHIIRKWRPCLTAELELICSSIQFVTDPTAHSEKIVSFSDNSVPGVLYVSIIQGDSYIDPYDLADSLIHEHRHQKLYLLERQINLLQPTAELVVSPWREDLRPPSGLLHAIFVFVELRRFWGYVIDQGPSKLHTRAVNQLYDTNKNLAKALETIESCPLTKAGRVLVNVLRGASSEKNLMPNGASICS